MDTALQDTALQDTALQDTDLLTVLVTESPLFPPSELDMDQAMQLDMVLEFLL